MLAPTNTPADRVIWVPMDGIRQLGGHDPATFTEMSAVLVKFKPGAQAAGLMLDTRYNRQGKRLTLAWPVASILADLFSKFDWFEQALRGWPTWWRWWPGRRCSPRFIRP